jgi:tetratricopeptide (TPR) repeat protein
MNFLPRVHRGITLALLASSLWPVGSWAQGTSGQSTTSAADIFFLDLGIVIEPATGNETYSRLVKAPSDEVKIQIKKVQSGSVYLAASREMLEALERIQQRMDQLENSFQRELAQLRQENRELRGMLTEFTAPPLPPPDEPPVLVSDTESDLAILADMATLSRLPTVSVPRQVELPPEPTTTEKAEFDPVDYMAGVFAYQREDYRQALRYFTGLVLERADPRTRSNILYWMADSYQQIGEYDQALEVLDRLLQDHNAGRVDDALIQKGLLYRKMGREELALAAFGEVVANHPDSEYLRLARMELKKAEVIP